MVQAVRLLVCSIVVLYVLVVRVLAIVPSGLGSLECVVVLVRVVVDCAVVLVVLVLVFCQYMNQVQRMIQVPSIVPVL